MEYNWNVVQTNYALTATNIMCCRAISSTNIDILQMPIGGGALANTTIDTSARLFITGFYFV